MTPRISQLIFGTLLLISLTTSSTAQETLTRALSNEERPIPEFWRENRYNLRWAGAASNLSYITRYIAEGMLARLGKDTGYIAFGTSGRSTSANLYAVGENEVDFAITTPPINALLASKGQAYFSKAYRDLRAIAVYPQNDWVMCVADPELGIDQFSQIRERQLAVRIATNPIGDENGVSFLVEQIFRAHGITAEDIRAWGGQFVEVDGAPEAATSVLNGEADIACHEYWKAFYRLTDKKRVSFLPITDKAFNYLSEEFGYRLNTIPKDIYGAGLPPRDIPAIDYSDWLVLANARLPDEIAYTAAMVAVEDRVRGFEAIYSGRPERQRSADIPLQPKLMWVNVGVPLHPGAARYYREAGLMPLDINE